MRKLIYILNFVTGFRPVSPFIKLIEMGFFTFLPLILGAVAAATVYSVRRARARARALEMEGLAQRLGLSFTKDDLYGLASQLKDFDLFRRERSWFSRRSRVNNVMRGQVDGTDVYLFDYSYVVSSGKSSRRITQTVFFANDTRWYLPDFHLRPENWWQKIRALFDKRDINFPENPEFSDQFWITGELESLIRKTFGPEVQQFLCERPPVHLEGSNFYLLAYKPRKALRGEEAAAFFEHCCQLVKLLKQEGKLELLNLAELKTAAEPLKAPSMPEKEEQ